METVWVREETNEFILGRLTELMGDEAIVVPVESKYSKITCPFDDIFQAGDPNKEVNDNCEMMFLNEATLLNNIKRLYFKDKIYSYVANILIVVNPYKEIPDLYSPQMIAKYHGKYIGQLPPHVFAIADKAARDIRTLKQSQSIIVSGESGAGKTESTKHLLRFLCEHRGSGSGTHPIQKYILEANPILETFGNAKTTRNNNSSRFGKFIEVHYDDEFNVVGGYISHYLLEKSRICSVTGEERTYHIFYSLLAGAPKETRDKLHLTQPDDYHYLKHGFTRYFSKLSSDQKLSQDQKSTAQMKHGSLVNNLMDDVENFSVLDKSLGIIGFSKEERFQIYSTVAAILHLGNIQFEEIQDDRKDSCTVTIDSEKSLKIASNFLGIDENKLRMTLVYKSMQSNKGAVRGTLIMVPLKTYEAISARDALAKAIYSKLFDYIVAKINNSIPFKNSNYYIGILDIAGFEFFTVNSFEQFCINYCNEKLQHFFNDKILKYEIELFNRETIEISEIKYVDNQDCIDIIELPKKGIFVLLDEQSKMPKPSYQHFTTEVFAKWPNNFRIDVPRKSKLQAHRNIRDNEGFLIRHFAGAVCYQTANFIEKNNDALHESLEGLIHQSKNKLVQSLFEETKFSQKGKLSFISVGNKFKSQLETLMEKLKDNGTNFIRCIRPNSNMAEKKFEGPISLSQLKSSGVIHALELMKNGYPSRSPFSELHSTYSPYFPQGMQNLRPKVFCEALMYGADLREDDYKFGMTRIFFKLGKFAELDTMIKYDQKNLERVIKRAMKWLARARWIQTQYGLLAALKFQRLFLLRKNAAIEIQKIVKGYLTKKRQLPRIKGLQKIMSLENNVQQLELIAQEVKKNKDAVTNDIKKLRSEISTEIARIKREKRITAKAIEDLYNLLSSKVNRQIRDLKIKIENDKIEGEREKLQMIEEEMDSLGKIKEKEEKDERDRVEIIKRKSIISVKKKQEIQERKKKDELDKLRILQLQEEVEKLATEEQTLRELLEQERHDHVLALRLAAETNGKVDENFKFRNRLDDIRKQKNIMPESNYDLSKWQYFELRNVLLNSPDDPELLEACKYEFHRRLKIYHEWRVKDKNELNSTDEVERVPPIPLEKKPTIEKPKNFANQDNTPRYFKVAFRKSGSKDPSKRGLWYAHFEGQYVVRQIHVFPNKPPVLLIAGKDDLQMCELSLDETGLKNKRGTAITEDEFNTEWNKYGGRY